MKKLSQRSQNREGMQVPTLRQVLEGTVFMVRKGHGAEDHRSARKGGHS